MPLSWDELGKLKSANQFTVANAAKYLDKRKKDPWKDFERSRVDLQKVISQKVRRVKDNHRHGKTSIWTGSINFGLVSIPIEMNMAVHEKTVHFHMLTKDGTCRLRRKLVCPDTGKEYDFGQTARGIEIAPDDYVLIDQREINRLKPEKGLAPSKSCSSSAPTPSTPSITTMSTISAPAKTPKKPTNSSSKP